MDIFISLIPLCFIIGFVIALSYKFYVKLVAAIAFPTYLVLYGIEYLLFDNKNLTEKKLYRLNLPKKIAKKTSMNTIASFITIINIYIIDKYILFFNTIKDNDLISKLKKVLFIDYRVVLVIIFLILIIYLMSYSEEIDERTGMEKIVDLKIPSLWKEVIKD